MVPASGTTLAVDGRTYAGSITISAGDGGLALVEETTIDRYLYGIAEVPFSWPIESLRAQAVAARTYLAWTLDRGRSVNGRRFEYDICATDQCQVYRGLDAIDGPDGAKWREAVDSTASLVLLDGTTPLQALYSSTSGGRTRSVEDVFGGGGNPHLSAVESPGETSPFSAWRFSVDFEQMSALAEAAGHLAGELVDVRTKKTTDGSGPWTVEFIGTEGRTSVPTWELRSDLNRAASQLFGDLFPVARPDRPERRYPQTIMSPSFTITRVVRYDSTGTGPPEFVPYFEVKGRGWGHLVGMSQYGAEAMARGGAAAPEILSHYYGGLGPVDGSDLLPAAVRVGLTTDVATLGVSPSGPVEISIDGQVVAASSLGSWSFLASGGALTALPPVGLGLPPDVVDVSVAVNRTGSPEVVTARLRSAAEVRFIAERRGSVVAATDWRLSEAGTIFWLVPGVAVGRDPFLLRIESRSPTGGDSVAVFVVPPAN